MKSIACALLLIVSMTSLRAGDVVEASDVVQASNAAKSKRKKSTSRVITNADVKKSKGKITENKAPLTPIDETPKVSEVEQYETARLVRIAGEEKTAAIDREIVQLEAELVLIERAYFEENDPNVRDGAIVRKFRTTQEKLDAKKKERDALKTPKAE
ncbi:MAG TPA: hypothetical protein VGF48_06765 [Thermoanaerobaculia bacterium]|jgi:hypothetical protein